MHRFAGLGRFVNAENDLDRTTTFDAVDRWLAVLLDRVGQILELLGMAMMTDRGGITRAAATTLALSHRLGNRLLTGASNLLTGLAITDMETCYKAFRRETLADMPLVQNRFGFEPEITARLARRRCRIVERPIGYNARTYAEGKKIGIKDGFNALWCIVRYGLWD